MSAPNPSPAEASGSRSPEARGGRHGHKSRFRTMTFPRKRAVTACDTCRWKKTKCGNERPICASCAKHDWPCSYDPRLDHASFDPASLLILDKLNQTLQKLAEIDQEVKGQNAGAGNDLRSTVVATATSSPSYGPPAGVCTVTSPSSSDCLEVLTTFGSTETILTWPIFNGRWPRNFLSQEILIGSLPSAHGDHRNSFKRGGRASRGINEEIVPSLVDRFLQLVHSKNPLFHTQHIREATRQVAEDGVGWDASSCIVLLACALGAVARPFNPSSEAGLLNGRTSLDDTFDLQTGDAFYQVARKRLGLLDQSIMAGQCHMLSGIYLMYTLRPLEAWSAFHQAGSTYSLYLRSQAALQERNNGVDVSPSQLERRLEQRLYWTVLKSECEIRVHLDLPQSDLCKLDYPFLFPSPPTPGSPAETPENHLHAQATASTASTPSQLLSLASTCSSQTAEEQTWFYYLSEIALRRIENRVLNAFYKEDPQHWVQMDLASMISAAQEIEAQMETWYASLPTSIRFDSDPHQMPVDELSHVTQGRSLLIHGLLYRPFLYYAIHAGHKVQTHWDLTTTLQGFVQKSLAICLACSGGHALTHRHHGTWYALRESVTTALMLLAARAADLITIDLQVSLSPQPEALDDSQQYARTLQICLERLRYWEAEAPPDIARAHGIIEELMSSMDES